MKLMGSLSALTSKARIIYPLQVSFLDYPNSEDCSVSVYFMGCDHNCKGCHNKEFQNHLNTKTKFGKIIHISDKDFLPLLEDFADRNRTTKVVLQGGDPLHPKNISFTKSLLSRNNFLDICVYTGYNIEYVMDKNIEGFAYIKTGKYSEKDAIKSFKTDKYFQLASTNQKMFDSKMNLISNQGRIYF